MYKCYITVLRFQTFKCLAQTLRKGHSYDAKVVHVNPRIGAFVDLGAVANGLIPLKMLGRTGNPTDILWI